MKNEDNAKQELMNHLEVLHRQLDDMKKTETPYEKLYEAVRIMADAVERRDPYKTGHQRRVADLARTIATEMDLAGDQVRSIHMAGIIHDVGKISMPEGLFSKPMRFTEAELQIMQTHVQSGYNILQDIDFLWPIARMVLEHHERMNGSGYPRGLSGDQLLQESRVLAVADVVDAISSRRPHRPALSIDAALYDIAGNRGVLFDTGAVDACLRLFREKRYKMSEDE